MQTVFVLGAKSLRELADVSPALVALVKRAIEITPVDFGVHDGIRSLQDQRALVAVGASKTLDSQHLVQADGYGHAVDLVPYINGQLRWEWGPIYEIAAAMSQAAIQQSVPLRWGGVWDRRLSDLGTTAADMKRAVAAYCLRHPGPDFIDGPHFELL